MHSYLPKQSAFFNAMVFIAIMLFMCLPVAHANIATTYNDTCGACHDTGALNAPKKGDKARWQQLKNTKGMPTLIKSVKEGMPQMPAGGLCSQCTDEQYQQLIDYMSQ